MRKHLWSKLSVILIIMFFVSPAWGGAGETELESYVPLRLHFLRCGFPFGAEITGTLSSDGKIHATVARLGGSRAELIIEPTEEEWQEFFNVVERANIWGLGEGEDLLPPGVFTSPTNAIFWRLGLKYPDRILNIEGIEGAIDTSVVDLREGGRFRGDRWRITISNNLSVANEFENIHRIFFAVQKLLGEDFSGYDFNLIAYQYRHR